MQKVPFVFDLVPKNAYMNHESDICIPIRRFDSSVWVVIPWSIWCKCRMCPIFLSWAPGPLGAVCCSHYGWANCWDPKNLKERHFFCGESKGNLFSNFLRGEGEEPFAGELMHLGCCLHFRHWTAEDLLLDHQVPLHKNSDDHGIINHQLKLGWWKKSGFYEWSFIVFKADVAGFIQQVSLGVVVILLNEGSTGIYCAFRGNWQRLRPEEVFESIEEKLCCVFC